MSQSAQILNQLLTRIPIPKTKLVLFVRILKKLNIIHLNALMRPLPRMPMQAKTLLLRRWNPWKHSHLHNDLALTQRRLALDRIAARAAKAPGDGLARAGRVVLVGFERAVAVLDGHAVGLDDQVCAVKRAGDFAAVGAVAEASAALGEEVGVFDRHIDAAAEAGPLEFAVEVLLWIVGLWIAGIGVDHFER